MNIELLQAALDSRARQLETRAAEAAEAAATVAATEAQIASEEDWQKRIALRHALEKQSERAKWLQEPFAVLPLTDREIAAVNAVASAMGLEVSVNLSSTGGFLVEAVKTRFVAVVKNAADIAAARTTILEKMEADAQKERERMVREINCQRDWYWRDSGRRTVRPEQPVTDEDIVRWKTKGQC